MAKIIDGKKIAEKIRDQVAGQVDDFQKMHGIIPRLSVVIVGNDPASQVYVKMKKKACEAAGMQSEIINLPENLEQENLFSVIDKLNSDVNVHGILIQLPLPKHLSEKKIIERICPDKDVDGLHVESMGKLFKGEGPRFLPCTPAGIIELILSTGIEIAGKSAVIIGRSNIVGKPTAMLLLHRSATVTICHSKTVDLPKISSQADILVAAIGRAKFVKADMVKTGAVVIDVGVNRTDAGLVGDVDYDGVVGKAGYITPVPGGVGPMTIAMLLKNTMIAADGLVDRKLS